MPYYIFRKSINFIYHFLNIILSKLVFTTFIYLHYIFLWLSLAYCPQRSRKDFSDPNYKPDYRTGFG